MTPQIGRIYKTCFMEQGSLALSYFTCYWLLPLKIAMFAYLPKLPKLTHYIRSFRQCLLASDCNCPAAQLNQQNFQL